jgi:hypothetical protein
MVDLLTWMVGRNIFPFEEGARTVPVTKVFWQRMAGSALGVRGVTRPPA